ncbi:hypothetical protein BPAE_0147g00020 [Botrytis paeoniae]|uniref:Uncharacterized protein n=1 Tax=Botrytis paeoniae TaxID=278948 RepID=A0A4Z1FIS7_9HELO|nr:hypothetical protein BPAE_0147g00020 [Botrytis paeoniae]
MAQDSTAPELSSDKRNTYSPATVPLSPRSTDSEVLTAGTDTVEQSRNPEILEADTDTVEPSCTTEDSYKKLYAEMY